MSVEPHRIALCDRPGKALLLVVAFTQLLGLGACALPRSAPSAFEFSQAGRARSINLIQPTLQDALATHEAASVGFSSDWRSSPTVLADAIGPGDVLSVTVFERDGLNVFVSGTEGSAVIAGLTVGQTGLIQLPYVGHIQVGGLTPIEARDPIVRSMRHLAVATDVTVSVTTRNSQLVSVQGDVSKPGVVALAPQSNRLLAVLATAAPNQTNLDVATVTVRRGEQSATLRLSDLYRHPEQNIALRNNDEVIVVSEPTFVHVLGTAGTPGRVHITRPDYSLLDAISDAHGLNDVSASPAAVYLMRRGEPIDKPDAVPRVYHFDFRKPDQIALAGSFVVHDGDSVLISDAPFTQTTKIVSALSLVATASRSVSQINPNN